MNSNNNNTAVKKDRRRYKYGSLSIAFTVVFLALILVVNVFFSSLSLSGDLTVDLTKEDFTAISDQTVSILSALGKDLDVTIYFMAARDMYDLEANTYNGINITGIIRDLAENFEKTFDGSGDKGTIKVEYKELNKDPEWEKQFLEESTTKLSATSVIVKGKHHYRVLDLSAFFIMNEQGAYHSFNGEYRFTAAFIQSSIAEPQVVTFTYGHGEPINANGPVAVGESAPAAGLVSLLSEAGFEIKYANLAQDSIDERTEILITFDPEADITYDEVAKLNKYLDANNSYMVFVDSATKKLDDLQAFLSDNWGINYRPNYRITDEEHSLEGKTHIINATYPEMDADTQSGSAAYQIRKTISDMGGELNVAMPECVELEIKENNTQDAFQIETVLTTYDTAVSKNKDAVGTEGTIPLMLLSTKHGYGENNVSEYSYVALVGSTDFAEPARTLTATGNRRVILSTARIFGSKQVAPDIEAREFADTALSIETGEATTLTWCICTIIPAAILICGFVVFYKRRHL